MMANQKKKERKNWENGKEKGGEKRMRARRNSVELWWRIPWTVTMDGPSAAQAILVYAPPSPISSSFLPPSPVMCPVTNPIIMPIQLSKLCAYFNFSSLFTVALFYFFCVFFFVAFYGLENAGMELPRGFGGRGKCSDWGGDILWWRLSATA